MFWVAWEREDTPDPGGAHAHRAEPRSVSERRRRPRPGRSPWRRRHRRTRRRPGPCCPRRPGPAGWPRPAGRRRSRNPGSAGTSVGAPSGRVSRPDSRSSWRSVSRPMDGSLASAIQIASQAPVSSQRTSKSRYLLGSPPGPACPPYAGRCRRQASGSAAGCPRAGSAPGSLAERDDGAIPGDGEVPARVDGRPPEPRSRRRFARRSIGSPPEAGRLGSPSAFWSAASRLPMTASSCQDAKTLLPSAVSRRACDRRRARRRCQGQSSRPMVGR